ncbi:MAG: DUF4163 domain-containing protein [Flavobacteriales bacterium]|nr:DUF4163 domain-containing protein [Flavobacteriales bacterium]
MLRTAAILLTFGFFLSIHSCKNDTEKKNILDHTDSVKDVFELYREGVVDYEIKSIKKVAADPSNKRKVISEIQVSYPKLKTRNEILNKSVKLYISQYVTNLLKNSVNEADTGNTQTIDLAIRAFLRSSKENIEKIKKESPEIDQVWFFNIMGNVEFQSDKYFTLRFKYDNFLGGTHGEYGQSYVTFNTKTGAILTLADIVSDVPKFLELAEKRFKQVNGLSTSIKLTEEEGFFFPNGQFRVYDNLGLCMDELIVYFEPYQVAPFSFGSTSLHFKYFEIIDLLNPKLFGEEEL